MTKVAALYVEICVFKYEGDEPRYLVLKRSQNEKVYPGIYQFITGTIETKYLGDEVISETAIEAALREMEEEINVKPRSLWSIPFINQFYVFTKDIINLSPMFLAEIEADTNLILSSEHESFEWCDYNKASKKLTWYGQRQALLIVNEFLTGKDEWGRLTRVI